MIYLVILLCDDWILLNLREKEGDIENMGKIGRKVEDFMVGYD